MMKVVLVVVATDVFVVDADNDDDDDRNCLNCYCFYDENNDDIC